jgi:hypothetical protein
MTAFSMERKVHVEQQEEEKDARGLEICTFERQLHRHKTIQCILSYCQNGAYTGTNRNDGTTM